MRMMAQRWEAEAVEAAISVVSDDGSVFYALARGPHVRFLEDRDAPLKVSKIVANTDGATWLVDRDGALWVKTFPGLRDLEVTVRPSQRLCAGLSLAKPLHRFGLRRCGTCAALVLHLPPSPRRRWLRQLWCIASGSRSALASWEGGTTPPS